MEHSTMKWLMASQAPCAKFVHAVAKSVFLEDCDYLAMPMTEFTLHGIQRGESNIRPDVMYCIGVELTAMSRGRNITVALELKGTHADLHRSENVFTYLGWTDYLYLGVPRDLLAEARLKVRGTPIGVVCVNDGHIHIYAQRQRPSVERQLQVYKQVVYNYLITN